MFAPEEGYLFGRLLRFHTFGDLFLKAQPLKVFTITAPHVAVALDLSHHNALKVLTETVRRGRVDRAGSQILQGFFRMKRRRIYLFIHPMPKALFLFPIYKPTETDQRVRGGVNAVGSDPECRVFFNAPTVILQLMDKRAIGGIEYDAGICGKRWCLQPMHWV